MSQSKDEPNAFPQPIEAWYQYRRELPGMSLRDYFAAKAMQGLVVQLHLQDIFVEKIWQRAYEYADAMLEARGESWNIITDWC